MAGKSHEDCEFYTNMSLAWPVGAAEGRPEPGLGRSVSRSASTRIRVRSPLKSWALAAHTETGGSLAHCPTTCQIGKLQAVLGL